MQYEILYPGPFCTIKIQLEPGEMVKAEAGSMVMMSPTIDVEGTVEGGVLKGLGRMLAGETFFFQTLVAKRGRGEVMLAHSAPGEIMPLELDGYGNYLIQKDGFLAGTAGLQIDTKMQNLTKGLFSGEGFFIVKVSGQGTAFVSSYGAIHPVDLQPGEEVIIDNHHLVAWPESMSYTIQKASSGWISSLKSGEGLVCRFVGPGRVYIQTRNPSGFGSWVRKFIPSK